MTAILGVLSALFAELGLPYEFGEWTGAPAEPYFVGRVSMQSYRPEERGSRGVFTLDGWSREGNLPLLQWAERLRAALGDWQGLCEGCLLSLRLREAQSLPTGEEGLYRLQLRLDWQSWETEGSE